MFVNEKKYILRYVIWYIYDLLDFDKRLRNHVYRYRLFLQYPFPHMIL